MRRNWQDYLKTLTASYKIWNDNLTKKLSRFKQSSKARKDPTTKLIKNTMKYKNLLEY